MGEHLIGGQFKSDKYPWCPAGFVPLKVTDPGAQGPLWAYAQQRRGIDAEFSADLEEALRLAGYEPGALPDLRGLSAALTALASRTPDPDWMAAALAKAARILAHVAHPIEVRGPDGAVDAEASAAANEKTLRALLALEVPDPSVELPGGLRLVRGGPTTPADVSPPPAPRR